MNNDLLNKIILIKESLDPKYIDYKYYLKEYDKKAYNLLNSEEIKNLLYQYENKCSFKEVLKHLDSPEVRYLFFSSFHDAKIYNIEYTRKALYIYLNGSQATSWPEGLKTKIILEFIGAKDVYVDKLPSFFDNHELQVLNNSFFITISSTCKSSGFSFKDIKFHEV